MKEEQVQSEEYRDVPVVRIKVSWADGEPIATPDPAEIPIGDREPTVIIWRSDRLVESIDRIWFENPGPPYENPAGEFTDPVASGPRVWVCVDKATTPGEFKYSIKATSQEGEQATADPMIVNQDR